MEYNITKNFISYKVDNYKNSYYIIINYLNDSPINNMFKRNTNFKLFYTNVNFKILYIKMI
jgi:hypothetical protein